MHISKPKLLDLDQIRKILLQWTEKIEVEKYVERIGKEVQGETEFNMHFWVAKEEDYVLGVVGLSDPLPKVIPLAKTQNPGEVKILYVDTAAQGRGVGKSLVEYVEKEAENVGYSELLVRSANRYKDSAYGFYEKMGYEKVGLVEGGDELKMMQVFGKVL